MSPRPQIEVGQHWKRPGDTLDWCVASYDENCSNVGLSGPADRKGIMYVNREELLEKWVRT